MTNRARQFEFTLDKPIFRGIPFKLHTPGDEAELTHESLRLATTGVFRKIPLITIMQLVYTIFMDRGAVFARERNVIMRILLQVKREIESAGIELVPTKRNTVNDIIKYLRDSHG